MTPDHRPGMDAPLSEAPDEWVEAAKRALTTHDTYSTDVQRLRALAKRARGERGSARIERLLDQCANALLAVAADYERMPEVVDVDEARYLVDDLRARFGEHYRADVRPCDGMCSLLGGAADTIEALLAERDRAVRDALWEAHERMAREIDCIAEKPMAWHDGLARGRQIVADLRDGAR